VRATPSTLSAGQSSSICRARLYRDAVSMLEHGDLPNGHSKAEGASPEDAQHSRGLLGEDHSPEVQSRHAELYIIVNKALKVKYNIEQTQRDVLVGVGDNMERPGPHATTTTGLLMMVLFDDDYESGCSSEYSVGRERRYRHDRSRPPSRRGKPS